MLQTNATLTKVAWKGVGDYDTPAEEITKWEGIEACYLESKTERITTSEGSELQRTWVVYLPVSFPVQFNTGDELTLASAPRGYLPPSTTVTVPVQAVDVRDEPDMPDDVCTVALTVEPASL